MKKPPNRPSNHQREISYRNGRKKGVIHAHPDGRPTSGASDRSAPQPETEVRLSRLGVWIQAPAISLKHWLLCLYALPVVTAAAVLWLIVMLNG